MRRARVVVAGLSAAVALLLVAVGCTSGHEAGRGTSDGTGAPSAAVAAPQLARILGAVAQVRPDGLDARFAGAELEVRRAALTVRAQVPTSPEPAPLAGDRLLTAVPPPGEWPRWFLTALQPGGGAVPQVVVLVQDGPRDPYRVVASAAVLPGASLPQPATTGGAAVPLAADAAGLALTPAQALEGYADVLTRGAEAPAAASLADDPLRAQVLSEQQAERDGVSAYVDYAASHTPREGALWSLRTTDGGALVVGVLSGRRSFTPRAAGVSQTLPPDLAALAGRDTAPQGLEVSTSEVVVLRVPTSGQAALVAGQRGTTGVVVR
ncbi:hypothetical protein FHN55_06675 [Streptomyces sp. NP160]|uniref:hypothetical protein n=1 Tax=Streptomyces sp. NP160 TaxID=2586637 RepID=UPI0011191BBC|nr:hypothetical protein [Streptomyces sp. NP160]TNM68482.1 hypothetical protein FHN55_06675 [Streptomyces sp. NP160]